MATSAPDPKKQKLPPKPRKPGTQTAAAQRLSPDNATGKKAPSKKRAKRLTPKMPGQVGSSGNVSPQKVASDMKKREQAARKRKAAKRASAKVATRGSAAATEQAMIRQAGRSMLKAFGIMAKRLGLVGVMYGLGEKAVTEGAKSMAKTKASQEQYEAKGRAIAKASAALKAPPKRGTNVMIAGQKVKATGRELAALRKVEVKDRPMDKPAKAKEPTEKKVSFGKAFAEARKAGKKEFTWNGKRYHTRTKEEEAARKKKSTSKALRRRRAMGQTGGYKRR